MNVIKPRKQLGKKNLLLIRNLKEDEIKITEENGHNERIEYNSKEDIIVKTVVENDIVFKKHNVKEIEEVIKIDEEKEEKGEKEGKGGGGKGREEEEGEEKGIVNGINENKFGIKMNISPTLSVIINDYDDDIKGDDNVSTHFHSPMNVHNVIGTVSANNSPKNTKLSPKSLSNLHIEATVLQIIDVLSVIESTEWVVLLIRETLHGKSEGNELQINVILRREESLLYCNKLLNCLIDILLKSEEKEYNLMLKIKGKRTSKEQIVAIVVTIAVFCQAHPPFAIDHLSILLPYLKVRTYACISHLLFLILFCFIFIY